MRIVVFGATGGTGRQVVEQALAIGHEVTAVARRPTAITLKHERLEVVPGDVLDFGSIHDLITGKDAVISAIGVSGRGPTVLYSQGIANIIQAMQAAHVRRLLCVSASGLDPGPRLQRLIAKPILWAAFRDGYTDMLNMEAKVKSSDLDWSIIRPPRLTNGPKSGVYHTAVNHHLSHGWHLSRADLAEFTLGQLEDASSFSAVIEIAH